MQHKSAYCVNSREWWEEYFEQSWDAHDGSGQTSHFMQQLLAALPPHEASFLRSGRLTILDWGCAFGEGVELLARAFPQSRVVGIDYASKAIEQARKRHPEREFILVEGEAIPSPFDVIITSNCLEHFERPLDVMKGHLRSCNKLYIAMVPYNEYPLSECHRSQFKEESFPERIGAFVRLHAGVIQTDPVYWDGQQILVVYGSPSYLRERAGLEAAASEQGKWDSFYSSLPLFEPDQATESFGRELVERVSELLPKGGRILEAGCGGGWQSLALARTRKFQLGLLDFSREALSYARRLFERENLSAEFIYGDVFTPGEPQFDLVFNAGVLEHYTLERQSAFLKGMATRARNYVMALVPNRLCYWYWLWRIQKSGEGQWPYGKEVPLIDLSAAYEGAGLRFLGQAFMGSDWTEIFINNLSGLDPSLRDEILLAHRSPLIPQPQKCYLLAALGSVSQEAGATRDWSLSPMPEDTGKAEMNAALADALAIRVGAEQRLSQLQSQLSEQQGAALVLSEQAAEKDRAIHSLSNQAAELEDRARAASSALSEKEQALQSLSDRLEEKATELASTIREADRSLEEKEQALREKEQALQEKKLTLEEKERAIQALTARIDEQGRTITGLSSSVQEKQRDLSSQRAEAKALSSELAEKERTIKSLSLQIASKEHSLNALTYELTTKEAELRQMKETTGWRLLSRYGRVKYRYLLPVYRMLGLPPYSKKGARGGQAHQQADNQPAHFGAASTPLIGPDAPIAQVMQPEQIDPWQSLIPYDSSAYDIVCFPIINWDFRFQRPQQLMSRFADAGHRVFYVSLDFRPSGPAYTLQEKRPNVYEVSLRGPQMNVYKDVLDGRACEALFASLDELRRDLLMGASVSFVQLPFWWSLAGRARDRFAWPVIYDCMDHHSGFSTNEEKMVSQERDLLESADLVVATSAFLEEQALLRNPNVLLVRNACEYEHFAGAVKPANRRPVIGYYGAIADWFDSDLVADLAERRPDWDFVLVGSTFTADTSRLSKLSNVTLPGEKPYSEIPDWLAGFDVAIIPFKRNALTEATNPVKAYEIFASGKPLVSVPIPEVALLAPLARVASSAEEFEREISAALAEEGPEPGEKRRAFASENTWEVRQAALAPAVRRLFPKASVIIVTFNNLDLNRLCLESLYARTEWPDFEVVVVDNASSDGTREYLRLAEQTFPNLRAVFNDSNLGFAAANNIGLAEARGDYLVLLNNDTVVTRGWLTALIRHLRVSPEIGMVGPVTNAIANEAKIEVGYTQLGEMPRWAADYVREHDRQTFDIPMLAMFCVAMSRAVFEKVGMLDERFGVGMFEDDDYCRRMREAGYELRCARDSFIHHWQRASFQLIGEEEYLKIYQENRGKYEKKWQQDRSAKYARAHAYDKQLREVLARAEKSKGVVIFLPSIGWDVHLFQRPHHLAREFARQGYVSIFDSSNSHDDVQGFKEIETGLFLFHGPEEVLQEIPAPILWAFPYNFDRKDAYPRDARVVYDWIDALEVFPYDRGFLERNHRRALKEASVVASVARSLHEQAVAARPDAIYLPNAVEFDRFAADAAIVEDESLAEFLREGLPVAGYYGALAEWFDYELLDEVARLRPDWNFLLIGQALDESLSRQRILSRPNVKWAGPRHYSSLPGYLARFDVTMIPFVINSITLATSPLKLYEYLAAGKPVITTPMPECESFPDVKIVRDAAEFARALDEAKALGRDEQYRRRARESARQNSWSMRVETVDRLLQSRAAAAGGEPPSSAAVETETTNEAETFIIPGLEGPAAEIAERFSHFRTENNHRFFNALCNHFSSLKSDKCLPMYMEFAITCNQRGRQVAKTLQRHASLGGRRYLDVGCAYGGFLVAFAEQGAEVIGIDYDKMLLNLARHNLRDNNLDAPLMVRDATRREQLSDFSGAFDLVTCNDVIEHVDDPERLARNIADILRGDGLAYFEIPNRYHPRFVLQDGHYQLFGITLLDYPEARQYYSNVAPGVPYGVRHYLGLDDYARIFDQCGMSLTVLEESFEGIDVQAVAADVAELRASAESQLSKVPAVVRGRLGEKLSSYLAEVEPLCRGARTKDRDFMQRYGAGFWRVLARKRGPHTANPGA